MREILVSTNKRKSYWGTVRARKKHSCPQYDNFMGIWEGIGELLKMFSSCPGGDGQNELKCRAKPDRCKL